MKCRYCGMSIDDDSVFCSACGKLIKGQPSVYRRLPRMPQKTRGKYTIAVLVVFAILIATIVAVFLLRNRSAARRIDNMISLVQNGYLGEYTDITVKEMLDANYGFYEKSIWDGGTTDAGDTIVQVKYYDENSGMEHTTIQFKMLNEECFLVSVFSSPFDTINQSTDLFAVLNNDYLVAYTRKNRFSANQGSIQVELLTRLDDIPGSAVAYGSSASYIGNRANICTLNGEMPLEVSTAMLLDRYGIIDMAVLYELTDNSQPTEPEATKAEDTIESVPKEIVPPQTTTTAVKEDNSFMVTVKWSSGGVNVRSGPGTSYGQMGRLGAGQQVLVTEIQYNGATPWGNIGSGWICMDYVETSTETAPPFSNNSTSVSMTVTVNLSVGELKIRSGPDTSYSEVGRLYGGEVLTVTELQQTGNMQWGRIAQGWICMDFVNTVFNSVGEQNNAERFIGTWWDQNSKRANMTIQHGEYGIFVIEINWGNSAFSSSTWRAVGNYDATSDCIRYHDCHYVISDSDGNGNITYTTYYTDGQGMLYFNGGNLLWRDYKENAGYTCSFTP